MIHIDAPAILFFGLSIYLLFNINKNPSGILLILLGCAIAFLCATKQTFWPLSLVFFIVIYIKHDLKSICKMLLGSVIATTCILIFGFYILNENPIEAFNMIWVRPIELTCVTPLPIVIIMLVKFIFPFIFLLLASALLIKSLKIKIPKEVWDNCIILLSLMIFMTPFALATRMKLGTDVNHLAIPIYCLLLITAILTPFIYLETLKSNNVINILSPVLLPVLVIFFSLPYLRTNCGWYLWNHNSQQQAMERLKNPHYGLYLPWQVLPHLIVDNKLYHIDDCLRYEVGVGWNRPHDSLIQFLPTDTVHIAIRPYGAASYLADQSFKTIYEDPMLPKWTFFKPLPIIH